MNKIYWKYDILLNSQNCLCIVNYGGKFIKVESELTEVIRLQEN